MAKNQNNRIRPTALQADLDALTALNNISSYAPANPAYTPDAVQTRLMMKSA